MVYTLFIFLPVAVCLFWLVVHFLLASKSETFPEFICLCFSVAVYLFSDACHATQPSGSTLDTGSLIVALFFGPCIIPLIIMYLRKLMHRKRKHLFDLSWILIPTVLFTGGVLLYFLNFDERVNQAFNLIIGPIFHGVLAFELVVLVVFIISTLRYNKILPGNLIAFFKGKRVSLVRLQIYAFSLPLVIMVLRIIIKDNLYTAQPWMAIASASIIMVSLYIFGLNALYGVHTMVSWHDFRYLIRYNYNTSNKAEVVEKIVNEMLNEAEEDALKRIQTKISDNLNMNEWGSDSSGREMLRAAEGIFKAVPSSQLDDDSLIYRFKNLILDKQMFLQPKLTLEEVAEELHSNKTYISKLVNNTYNLGFPELINTLRVDYAEQFILSHRDAKQDEIATKSGFLSASSFNTIFKKVTGVTPKVWVASIDRRNK